MANKKNKPNRKKKTAAKSNLTNQAAAQPSETDNTTAEIEASRSDNLNKPDAQKLSKQNSHPRTLATDSDASRFPIVGIGASAGGLEALEEFFRSMPTDSGMAFVVVMHQSAKHVSLLPELLAKCTDMQVAAIREGQTIEPNRVSVVPPGMHADCLNGKLHLSAIPPRPGVSLPIDHFFRSLAAERQERSVAIVLSGTGSDGTLGLSSIKDESGMVMVQSIESAKFDGMPQSAIDTGWPDYVLPPAEMTSKLMGHARGPFLKASKATTQPCPAISDSVPEILLMLRRRCGHDFSGYKPSTIYRRIERRMNVHQILEPKQYVRYLGEHHQEAELLFKDLLIGVTAFFRDPLAFIELTEKSLKPMLRQKPSGSAFRVWVPGCASGEEAYTIAILIRECMDELNVHLNVQIFATDLDAIAIECARTGLFPSGIESDVSPERLAKSFSKHENGFRIRKELRDWLVFAPQNVIHDPPFTKLDLISCRNLLIYLQGDLQKKLLTLFHYSLVPGGTLFLGTSESIGEFTDVFETIDNRAKIFQRKETPSNRSIEFPITASPSKSNRKPAMAKSSKSGTSIAAISELLVNCFAQPTVIVNDKGEIIHVHGRTGSFLELAEGGPPKGIVEMAREGLELDLASALRKAARHNGPVVHRNVQVKTNGKTEKVDLTVERITFPQSLAGLIRVSFHILSPDVTGDKRKKLMTGHNSKTDPASRERELENELQHTRDSLQRSIEELDASNEEMKSTNEELQSTNEELQSTNEELETSKEELQSLNEELQTVNAEFQDKIHDLSRANDDMNNLLNATEIATIFLDNQICIKRFNEQATKIIRMIPTDLGRPLGDITSRLEHHDLVADCRKVLKTLVFKETEVCTADGYWLLLRLLPYRTSDNRIDGLVMTFVDINELKQIQARVEEARDFAENIVSTVREPMLVLDADYKLMFASEAFCSMFQVDATEEIGRSVYELGRGQWNLPPLRKLLETILGSDSTFDGFEVQYQFPDRGPVPLILYGRRIAGRNNTADFILLGIEEEKT